MKILLAVVSLALFVHSSHGQSDIIDSLAGLGITTLKTYLDAASLTDALKGLSDCTLFAPTDAAFAALPQDVRDRLESDTDYATAILTYHAVNGARAMSSSLSNEQLVGTMNTGKSIRINIYGSGASTVITASGSQVTNPDQTATNGVIHVIDKVMTPPDGNIVEYAVANNFNNLTDLATRANLVTALSGGNLTVFAPTNTAFGNVPKAILDELLADNDKLTKVLTYHVIDGVFFSKGLASTQTVPTLMGDTVTITKAANGEVKINGITVTMADGFATNGVVHVIGSVLVPEGVIGAAGIMQPSVMLALLSALLAFFYQL